MSLQHDIRESLSLVRPLAGLPPEWIDQLVAAARLMKIGAGESVAEHGRPHPGLIIVHEGELELSITSHTGRRHVLARLGRGQTFGIVAALDSEPALYTSRACGDALAIVVPRESLLAAIRAGGDFAVELLTALAERTRLLLRFVGGQATLAPLGRVADVLLTLAAMRRWEGEGEAKGQDLRFSQSDIADMMGITRQSLSAQLQILQSRGALSLQYRSIRILDFAALQALVER